jgi:hypothetical protein
MEKETAMIDGLQDPSPEFQEWVAEMEKNGFLTTILEAMAAIDEKYSDPKEALNYLCRLSEDQELDNLKLACADFKEGEKIAKLSMSKLRIAQNRRIGTNANFICGIIGHTIISRLVLGGIFKSTSRLPKLTPSQLVQLSFNFNTERQMSLFGNLVKEAIMNNQEAILGDFIDGRRIEKKWLQVLDVFERTNNQWPDWYWNSKKMIDDLLLLLAPLLGHHLQTILKLDKPKDREFVSLSILTLASAVAHLRRAEPRIIFSEIPILRHEDDIHGGRIDAIEVVKIGTSPPSKKQKRILRQLAKFHFSSLPQLLYQLKLSLGTEEFALEADDWKFFIGDLAKRTHQLSPGRLPQRKHLEQLARYLIFCSFGRKLDEPEKFPDYWTGFESGNLTYLLPTKEPFVHKVELGSLEKRHVYATQVLNRLDEAERRAVIRNITNNIISHIIGHLKTKESGKADETALNGNATNGKRGKNGHSKNNQLPLIPEISAKKIILTHKEKHDKVLTEINTETSSVPAEDLAAYDKLLDAGRSISAEIPNEEKEFIDPFQIIENVGRYKKDGIVNDILELNLNRLLETIAKGHIKTGRLTMPKGGNISCLNKAEHRDDSPSMNLRFDRHPPTFFCFACGIKGRIVSLPEKLQNIAATADYSSRPGGKWQQVAISDIMEEKAAIPEEHLKIMDIAQQILRSRLKGSRGEKYLAQERYIDIDLAESTGVGYGDNALIGSLIRDAGYSLEQLIQYGFVGFHENVTPETGLAPFLIRLGYKNSELKREIKVIDDTFLDQKNLVTPEAKKIFGYPYSVLQDRITFPLEWNPAKPVSFYGRYAGQCDAGFAHRKLIASETGIPHGAFNIKSLYSSWNEIIVVEAPIDCLSLLQTGFPNVLAIVGLYNYLILEMIIASNKKLALAFDNDKPKDGKIGRGQKGTEDIAHWLKNKGLQEEKHFRNFTASFVEAHHEIAYFKDFNDFLKKQKALMQI